MSVQNSNQLGGLAGVAGGFAPLDSGLLVPVAYLPKFNGLTSERSSVGASDVLAGYDDSAGANRAFPVGVLLRSRTHTVVGSDFFFPEGSTIAGNGVLDTPFIAAFTGTGSGVSAGTSTANHPGVILLDVGTSTTGRCGITTITNGFGVAGRMRFMSVIKITTLSDGTNTYACITGISNAIGGLTGGDAISFYYSHSVNGGRWLARAGNSVNGETTADTGVAADTNWHCFEWEVNEAATSVDYYIDGTLVATISGATIPSSVAERIVPFNAIKSAGGTSRTFSVDMVNLAWGFPSR